MKSSWEKYAVIFDMDGVLADTRRLHYEIEAAILNNHGIYEGSQESFDRYAGVSDLDMFADILARHHNSYTSAQQLVDEKWGRLETVAQSVAEPMPHVIGLLEDLQLAKFRLGVASGSPRCFIEKILAGLDVSSFFSTVVSSDEVEHGKPAPDVFLEAASRLGVLPSFCLVVEDGIAGMAAAKAAGMLCVGLVSDRELNCCADLKITSLKEIGSTAIGTLFSRIIRG